MRSGGILSVSGSGRGDGGMHKQPPCLRRRYPGWSVCHGIYSLASGATSSAPAPVLFAADWLWLVNDQLSGRFRFLAFPTSVLWCPPLVGVPDYPEGTGKGLPYSLEVCSLA